MRYQNNRGRPILPDRFSAFTELRESVRNLQIAYEQTHNTYVLKSIRILERMLEQFEASEFVYRQQEVDEALVMPDLPYSVRIWLLYYREKDMAL